jgi:dTDP-4-amino-4,6-dideoxygalactose transaminase
VNPLAMVDMQAVHAELGAELEAAVLRVVRSGRYVGGAEVTAFEQRFADYLGVEHAVALGNGTDALQLALIAAGVGRGAEVLVPANTFIATAEAVVATGGTPRFVDVDPATGLIDLECAAALIGARTKAILPVHLYGRMADMDAVMEFAAEHDMVVIEDAAQAHGAARGGRRAGTIGAAGCFSFYPGKNLGALGDAGAAVTSDRALADRIRLLRDHGRSGRDNHVMPGYNSRMDPIQAAVLSVKLPHLDRWTAARRHAAAGYRERLAEYLDWSGDDEPQAEVHHLFPILVEDRDDLMTALGERGIPTGVHYRQSLTTAPAFAPSPDGCPVADRRAATQLSLPMHPHLDDADVQRIVDAVRELARPASALG